MLQFVEGSIHVSVVVQMASRATSATVSSRSSIDRFLLNFTIIHNAQIDGQLLSAIFPAV